MQFLLLFLLSFSTYATKITLTPDNHINFNKPFTDKSITEVQLKAYELSAKTDTIYLVLYTPGGSVSAGQSLYQYIKGLGIKVHTITLFAASMGYQTVQHLGKRYMTPYGTLMSHRASIKGLGGEIGGELDSFYNYIKSQITKLEDVSAKRVGVTLSAYRRLIADELWLTSEQAVSLGHADEIVDVKCSKELMTTRVERMRSFFGTFDVEFSNCPVITAPLRVVGKNEKDKRNKNKFEQYYNNIKDRVKMWK